MLYEGLLNKKSLARSVRLILNKNKQKDERVRITQELWGYILRGNIKQIFTQVSSKEKVLFLSALHQESLKVKMGLLYFAPHYTTTYELFDAYYQFQKAGTKKDKKKLIKDKYARISSNIYFLFYKALNLKSSYHVNLNIFLSDILIEEKPVKVDMLIWRPMSRRFKLIIQLISSVKLNPVELKKHGYKLIQLEESQIISNPDNIAQEIIKRLIF